MLNIIKTFKKGIYILLNSDETAFELPNRTFEDVLSDYLVLLLSCGILSVLFEFLYSIGFVVFFDLTKNMDVSYLKVINYSLGNSVSSFFLYIFCGTFLMFFLSLILFVFLKKVKYMNVFKVLLFSFTPVLLFGWIRVLFLGLLVWAFFLFFKGIALFKKQQHTSKKSINFRD